MNVAFPNESAEHRAARDRLLQKEIELRRAMEAVAQARRELPKGGLVPEDYVFDGIGDDGRPAKFRLSELFAPGKDTLVVYNMMFPRHVGDTRPKPAGGPLKDLPVEETPCPSCTSLLDQLNPAARPFEAAGFNFAVVAQAPIERVAAFAKDRGWKHLRMLSGAGNSFKRDYNALFKDGQLAPMLSVFHRDHDGIRHFWSSEMMHAPADPGQDPRANGTLEPLWNLMDFTPEGRPDFDEQLQYDEPCCHGAKPAAA
jgi:predicted dithiol-disulfide oxidoreductase (DUF899 family)